MRSITYNPTEPDRRVKLILANPLAAKTVRVHSSEPFTALGNSKAGPETAQAGKGFLFYTTVVLHNGGTADGLAKSNFDVAL
jgi:hypothetical protein